MLFAVLEFGDFFIIALLIGALAGGRAAASAYLTPGDGGRMRQIERKLDLILAHLGITPEPATEW